MMAWIETDWPAAAMLPLRATALATTTLPWAVALGVVGALLMTAVLNFLVRETLALVRARSGAAVPITGQPGPSLLRVAWAFSALAGLLGAVLVLFVLNAAGGSPAAEIAGRLAGPPAALMMAITTITACVTAGMLAFCFLLLRHRSGTPAVRVYFLVLTLAWVLLMAGLYFTNWFQLG